MQAQQSIGSVSYVLNYKNTRVSQNVWLKDMTCSHGLPHARAQCPECLPQTLASFTLQASATAS